MTRDRPIKRAIEIRAGRYLGNPLVRGMLRAGLTPPLMVLVETKGRRSGKTRRVPVAMSREGDALWLIAQHGRHAGWVRNLEADPHVRVRLGRHWQTGVASVVAEDDVKARARTFASSSAGRFIAAATFRALESNPMSVRIALD
jgi:deazaflavin-dependent oxidoreductase (nitroreductase family)